MCLILLALRARPDLPLILAANRDEFYARPTAAAAPWPDAPHVVAGRDLRDGGTWLGITRSGRWAAVTNFREQAPARSGAPSRGRLVSDFLLGDLSPSAYLDPLRSHAAAYNGFNLFVGDADTAFWFSNRAPEHPLSTRPLEPGIYGLSNHLLDTPWPKVERGKDAMRRAVASGAPPEDLLHTLLDRTLADDADLPATGLPADLERALSAAFIAGADYGTRSSTVIHRGADGHICFLERSFAPPDQVSVVRHELDPVA
ncbi:MAG TPA: NRDE family protein [Longimicrobiaceae bacterium]